MLRGYQIKSADQIGGGIVRHPFRMGARYLTANTKLSPDEVMSINAVNRGVLIDKGFIAIWPRGDDTPAVKVIPITEGERFAVHTGGGRYDVIEGRRVNDASLSREEAQAMTGTGTAH